MFVLNNENGSSKLDTVLRIMMIAFISLLAFSSGVWFGKKLSDSDYQLKIVEGEHGHGANPAVAGHGGSEGMITDDEVTEIAENALHEADPKAHGEQDAHAKPAGKAPREVASDKSKGHDAAHGEKEKPHASAKPEKKDAHAASTHVDAHAKPEPAHQTDKTAKVDLSAAHKAAERVAHGEAPSVPAVRGTESRTPNSLPTAVGSATHVEYTVQVASYQKNGDAQSHADRLVKEGYPAFPVEAVINGKSWYRVSVGSFKTMKEAAAYQKQLLKQAQVETAIVQKIQR